MGRKNYQVVIALLVGLSFFASCKKENKQDCCTVPTGGSGKVYIVCEGNMGNGDASLYAYDIVKDSTYGDLYQAVNHQALGDVFQSMAVLNGNLFLCINNSDKIVVLNRVTWQLMGTISVPKPRYIVQVSSTKAYVSTIFSNKVYIINPETFSVSGIVALPGQNPEGMLLNKNGEVLVCPWDTLTNQVYKIGAGDAVSKAFTVAGNAPEEILADRENKLWVLSGDQPGGTSAVFTVVDPNTNQAIRSYKFPKDADPLRPVFNNTKDTLYFIEANHYGGTANNGIYRMSITDTALPQQPFVPALQNQYFWALGIDPKTSDVYIGDPKGFIQKGNVYIYHPNGQLYKTIKVGLGPGHFLFDYQ